MNHTMLSVAGVFSASSLLLVDSAVKGTALLVVAAVAAIILRRDSAATRHLVWLLGIVAMLIVPALSAMLPQWRVLPEWAGIPPETAVVSTRPPSIARAADVAVDTAVAQNADPEEVESPSATAYQPAAGLPDSRPAPVTSEAVPASAGWGRNWLNALPLVWAIGFCVLILRLMAARLMLWNTERQGMVIWSSGQSTTIHDPIVIALEAACLQLGMCRPVTLLIHPDKTIPVVWGILRRRLLLPVAARHWSGEQLRSVLLHELAHIKRRDTMAQLLAQIACALYWFNPPVWFAAWRLGVEGERACDDLVLASGVRPSAYAGHLLEVVTGLSPARWTQSCGLAMARKSSLEGRLVAILSENLNRRGVSAALATIALAIAVGIAVPIAMLRAADEKPGAPVQQQESQKPKDGARLQPATEETLRWGEPVNGLRAALVIRPSSDEPKAGDMPDLYLAMQNVSNAPIRFSDTTAAPRLRYLRLKRDGETLFGIVINDPTLADVTLQPRDAAFLLMFVSDWRDKAGRTEGSAIAEGTLKDWRETLVAELKIVHAPAGAWTGKLVTGETSGAAAAGKPQPRNREAQALFKVWEDNARRSGNIPGGLVGHLGDKVNEFIRINTGDASGDPYAKRMAPLVPRFDAARDWTPAEAVALLDDIAAISAIPLETTMEEATNRTMRTGAPLTPELANASWGEALPNGLRMAWALEPRAEQHRLGTPLKSRILIHNSGQNTVVFRTRTWHQSAGHEARDAKGADITIHSTEWTRLAWLVPFRLAPGEFVELDAAGIGVGASATEADSHETRLDAWVETKAGDEVTFTPDSVPLSDWNEAPPRDGEPGWWSVFIAERLNRESPLSTTADERTRLLGRVMRDLFGAAPTPEETAAFTADAAPAALDSLARRLAHRPGLTPFTGALTSGPTTFRVLPADPDAAKAPRTASGPGHYTLGEDARLVVSHRPVGTRIANEARIQFVSPDPTKRAPGKPYEIRLPDGYNTWAAAWVRGSNVLWVLQEGTVRGYDFTNPAEVKETTVAQPENREKVPRSILDALRAAVDVHDAPATPK
jgi:beta-lactamase regulating signal transducer with metallopeptidase domain